MNMKYSQSGIIDSDLITLADSSMRIIIEIYKRIIIRYTGTCIVIVDILLIFPVLHIPSNQIENICVRVEYPLVLYIYMYAWRIPPVCEKYRCRIVLAFKMCPGVYIKTLTLACTRCLQSATIGTVFFSCYSAYIFGTNEITSTYPHYFIPKRVVPHTTLS